MGKLKLSSEEKNQILESHNKYRDILMGHLFDPTLVSEQVTQNMPARDLFALAKQNCKADGAIGQATIGNHKGKTVLIYKPTTKHPEGLWDVDDEVYFYADGTFIVETSKNGESRVKSSAQWNCPNLPFERDRVDNLISTLRSDYKYFQYDDAAFKPYQKSAQEKDQTVLDIIQVGNTLLYRPKTALRTPGTQTENDIINSYLQRAYGVDPADLQGLWKLDPTEAEKQELFALVIPKSAGLTQNYQIWLDLTKLPIKTQNKLTKADIKSMQSQFNEKACSTIIVNYYNTWLNKVPRKFADLEIEKQKVLQCLAQQHNYGTLGLGGKNVEKAVLALYGRNTGDPKFPSLPKNDRDRLRPVIRQVKTADGEKVLTFDFRLFQ
jgi:hypothetical protein